MAVERADAEPGFAAENRGHEPAQKPDLFENRFVTYALDGASHRFVQRDVHDAQPGRRRDRRTRTKIERHAEIGDAAPLRENFRVARIVMARKPERFFVQRRGNNRVDGAAKRRVDRATERAKRRLAPFRADRAVLHAGRACAAAGQDGYRVWPELSLIVARRVVGRVDRNGARVEPAQFGRGGDALRIAEYDGPVYLRFGRPKVPNFTPVDEKFVIVKQNDILAIIE